MADIAFQQQFRQEFIGAFEMTKTQLRETVVKEADVRGNQATFLVAGSGGAEAKTRGVDGKIPATKSDLNQYTCTLVEKHHKEIRTSFDILSSQGNIRDVMQRSAAAVINRAMDQQIIDELANATVNTGAAATASLNLVVRAKTILGNNKVRTEDGQLFGLVTPAFMGYLQTLKEFSSVDYVDMKALVGGDGGFSDGNRIARWMGINWITHSELDGAEQATKLVTFIIVMQLVTLAIKKAQVSLLTMMKRMIILSSVLHSTHKPKFCKILALLKLHMMALPSLLLNL